MFAGGTHVATIDSAGVKHVHKDHLGSARLVTSATGSVVSQHSYWPFGEEMAVTSSPERMRFAGHERDLTSFLDYMHARFYAPWGGRFLSVDQGRDDDFHKPQSFNLYAYVRNNPVNAVAGNGRAAFPALWVGPVVGAVAGGAAHLVVNRVILGKSWGDSFRGIHRSMAVGALGGVGKAGPLLAGVGAGFNAFKDARSSGVTTKKALERAVEIGAITLHGGSVGPGVAVGLGAASGSVPSEFSVAAGAAVASEVATNAIAGAEALRQELQPWAHDSSRNLADQKKQLEELKKQEEEAAKRLVRGTDRTNPGGGEEEQ
ncbi:MAG: RHS repeat-associated core domain-containing protein [Candidatus Hadarchaeum sp.]